MRTFTTKLVLSIMAFAIVMFSTTALVLAVDLPDDVKNALDSALVDPPITCEFLHQVVENNPNFLALLHKRSMDLEIDHGVHIIYKKIKNDNSLEIFMKIEGSMYRVGPNSILIESDNWLELERRLRSNPESAFWRAIQGTIGSFEKALVDPPITCEFIKEVADNEELGRYLIKDDIIFNVSSDIAIIYLKKTQGESKVTVMVSFKGDEYTLSDNSIDSESKDLSEEFESSLEKVNESTFWGTMKNNLLASKN